MKTTAAKMAKKTNPPQTSSPNSVASNTVWSIQVISFQNEVQMVLQNCIVLSIFLTAGSSEQQHLTRSATTLSDSEARRGRQDPAIRQNTNWALLDFFPFSLTVSRATFTQQFVTGIFFFLEKHFLLGS